MKKIFKFFISISWIIILFFVLVVFYLNYQKLYKNDTKIEVFHYQFYIVTSSSMEPTYKPNDFLISKEEKNYDVNDIVVFIKNQETITHRIVAINYVNGENQYITMGDHNGSIDYGFITKDQIQGKIIYHIDEVGSVIHFMQTPTGILVSIIGPAFIAFLYYFQKVMSEFKHKQKNE